MSDPMSDVLRSVRLSGGVFLDVQLTEPFCLISELTAADCRPLLDDPVQLVFYHVVLKGRATMILPGEHPVEVGAGEVAILPHNDTHTVASAPGLSPTIARSLVQPAADGGLARIVYGGGGAETHMFCGFLGSTERRNPVLAMLPRLVTLDLRSAAAREWIESSVRFAAGELAEGRLASSGVMSRLSEVLLVEAVRQFAAGAGPEGPGWLRGWPIPRSGARWRRSTANPLQAGRPRRWRGSPACRAAHLPTASSRWWANRPSATSRIGGCTLPGSACASAIPASRGSRTRSAMNPRKPSAARSYAKPASRPRAGARVRG